MGYQSALDDHMIMLILHKIENTGEYSCVCPILHLSVYAKTELQALVKMGNALKRVRKEELELLKD